MLSVLQTINWHPLTGAPPPSKLKQLAREGVPTSLRPAIWFQLSGGAAIKRQEQPGYYCLMSSMGKDPELNAPELSLDLFRTFSTNAMLSSKKALEAVRRIVTAFGRRNHSNAYSSNVNYIVAFLLAVLGLGKEEEAFWILTALLERRLPASSVLEVIFLYTCLPELHHAGIITQRHWLLLSCWLCASSYVYYVRCHADVRVPVLRHVSSCANVFSWWDSVLACKNVM